MAPRDHLRRSVLDALWSHSEGLTAAEVVELLPGRELALTTVLTVLERLRKDGLVEREREGRSFRHQAAVTREDFLARVMLEALGESADRQVVLARFVNHVSTTDADALRSALSTGCGCGPGCGCRPGPGEGPEGPERGSGAGHDHGSPGPSVPASLAPGSSSTGRGVGVAALDQRPLRIVTSEMPRYVVQQAS